MGSVATGTMLYISTVEVSALKVRSVATGAMLYSWMEVSALKVRSVATGTMLYIS